MSQKAAACGLALEVELEDSFLAEEPGWVFKVWTAAPIAFPDTSRVWPLKWSRLSEQIFRVDKWSVCRGYAATRIGNNV